MAYDIDKLTRYRDVKEFAEKLNKKVEPITYNNAYAHNAICGGRNLGTTITAEQIANVRNGTFKGLYPGDFWQLAVDGTTIMEIAGCDLYNTPVHPHQLIVTLRNESWQYPMNDTLTCEGHLTGMSLFNEVFPALAEKIEAVIDPSYIQNTQDYQATGINAEGKVTTRGYPYSKLFLPSCQNLNMKDTEDPNNQAYSIYSNVVWPRFLHNPKLPWSWDASHDYAWLDANLTDKAWMVARSRLRIAGGSNVTNTCYVFPYMFIV